jgi:hypothetical protein
MIAHVVSGYGRMHDGKRVVCASNERFKGGCAHACRGKKGKIFSANHSLIIVPEYIRLKQ